MFFLIIFSLYFSSATNIQTMKLLLSVNFVVYRPKDATGQFLYVDGSRSPSFYTASPAESDVETMTGDYGMA